MEPIKGTWIPYGNMNSTDAMHVLPITGVGHASSAHGVNHVLI